MTVILFILTILFGATTVGYAIAWYGEKRRTKDFTELRRLQSELERFKTEHDQTLKLLAELRAEKTGAEALMIQLAISKKGIENEMSGLKSKISTAEIHLEAIQTQSAAEKIRVRNLQKQQEAVEQECNAVGDKVKKLLLETAQYKSRRDEADKQFELSNSSLMQLQNEIVQVRKEKASIDTELSALNRLLAEKKNFTVTAEQRIKIIKPQPQEDLPRREVKYIGYQPSYDFLQRTKPFRYPFVSMPKPASVIKFPRKLAEGKIGVRGYKEPDFDTYLLRYFKEAAGFQFYNDRFLFISDKTNPYVPDHVLIDERNNLNLFIDVEIDEPYEALSRLATHEQGKDDFRNTYFNDRGWVVVRFAEIQVHQNILGCCKLIAEVIKSVFPRFQIHADLQKAQSLTPVPFWKKFHAEKWAVQRYRETYLGIEQFGIKEGFWIPPLELAENSDDKAAEKEVRAEPIEFESETSDINLTNAHVRDGRLEFNAAEHRYFIDGNPNTISGTTFIHRFFPAFDSEYWGERKAFEEGISYQEKLDEWEEERVRAAALGTALHKDIDQFFHDRNFGVAKTEFQYFLDLYATIGHLELYRTEWRIFDDVRMIAGTADAVFKKADSKFVIFDWKRSKAIKTNNPWQKGFHYCSSLDDCNYNHYCLQLNLYKRILEEHYFGNGFVDEMYFVQLHPNKDSFQKFVVPDMQDKIDNMYIELLTQK